MPKNKRVFLRFMDRHFYDDAHVTLFLEANGYGFKGEKDKLFLLGYTREEFFKALSTKRTRLPNGERIQWDRFSKLSAYRLRMIRNTPFGFQVDLKVMAEDPFMNFLLFAPPSTFDGRIPYWYITGADWGNSILFFYPPGHFHNFLKRNWTDEYALRFGITWREIFDYIHTADSIMLSSYTTYCIIPALKLNKRSWR